MSDDSRFVICRNFRKPFKRPLVMGRFGDWKFPFVVSILQASTFALSFAVLFNTRSVWGRVVPGGGFVTMLVIVAVSVVAAWQLQTRTINGRSPFDHITARVRALMLPRSVGSDGLRLGPSSTVVVTPQMVEMPVVTRPQRRSTRPAPSSVQDRVRPARPAPRNRRPVPPAQPYEQPQPQSFNGGVEEVVERDLSSALVGL